MMGFHYKGRIFLLVLFLYMLFCNYMAPMFADDYGYFFSMSTGKPVDGIVDVLRSQYVHWMTWGGRSVAHTFAQYFLYLGKPAFNVVNSFVFTLVVMLIYWFSRGEKPGLKFDIKYLFMIVFFLWLGICVFGETVFWLIGACNYLWTAFLLLLFMYPYRLALDGDGVSKSSYCWRSVIFFLGILAGWTNENAAVIMLLIVAAVVVYFYKKNQLQSWMSIGFLGALIGFVFLIAAPGNFVRADSFANLTFWWKFKQAIRAAVFFFCWQMPIWITIAVLAYKLRHRLTCEPNRKLCAIAIAFALGSIGANLVMMVSPLFPARAGFASSFYLVIAVMILFHFVEKEGCSFSMWLKYGSYILAGGFLVLTMAFTAQRYYVLHQENIIRVEQLLSAKQDGCAELLVKPFSVQEDAIFRHVFVRDITVDAKDWRNAGLERYFGIPSIRLAP